MAKTRSQPPVQPPIIPPDCLSNYLSIYLSRLFHLPCTLDANQQPTDTTSRMTCIDLLQPTPRKQKKKNFTAELEYEKSIASLVTEGGGKIPNTKSSQLGRLH